MRVGSVVDVFDGIIFFLPVTDILVLKLVVEILSTILTLDYG